MVLIILAVVSINAVMGDNGIIKQAEKAGQYQLNAEASEEELLDTLDQHIENAIGNQVKTIKFKIEDVEYTAEEGMTWENWINSEYNVDGYKILENAITDSTGQYWITGLDGSNKQEPDYDIEDAYFYYEWLFGESPLT